MKLQDFDFNLPEELIAKYPMENRDKSRLLFVDGETIRDEQFCDITNHFKSGDLIIFNNSKVIPSRLTATLTRTSREFEITFHKPTSPNSWIGFCKGSKKLKINDEIVFAENFTAKIKDKDQNSGIEFEFNLSNDDLINAFKKYGKMPLPPYMKREEEESDKQRYQTIYAKPEGSVAAPTAGLHFTPEILQQLNDKGIKTMFITLHVGAGTFLPVKTEDLNEHKMHAEYGQITQEQADIINQTKKSGGKVIATGTTSLRLLESATDTTGITKPFAKETDIFIHPDKGYKFKCADYLITNFHTPKSTLVMLVQAFAGRKEMIKAYEHAIKKNYRFYSYGDSSLLKCKNHI